MKIILQTPINSLGYGIFGLGYYNILRQYHTDTVNIYPIGEPNVNSIKDNLDILGIDSNEFIAALDFNPSPPFITLGIWHLLESYKIIGNNKILHTTFETTSFDKTKVPNVKKDVKKVLTPSDWGVSILESHSINSGCVVGPASLLNTDIAEYNKFHFIKQYLDEDLPIFLSCGKWEGRKNHMTLIDTISSSNVPITLVGCWNNVFTGGLVQPMIYLNNSGWKMFKAISKDNILIYIYKKDDNTIVLMPHMDSYKDLLALYNLMDIYITISSGEGWDLPLVETMSLKKPHIATYNTAHMQYLKKDDPFILGCTEDLANDGVFFDGNQGNWYPIKNKQLILDTIKECTNLYQDPYNNKLNEVGQNNYNTIAAICDPEKIYNSLKEHCEF